MRSRNKVSGFRASACRAGVIAGLVASCGLAGSAAGQNWHWNTQDGDWSVALNWLSLVPPPANANVFLGSTSAAENGFVALDVSASVANLVITDGMTLNTTVRSLQVAGNTVISGLNTTAGNASFRSTLRVGSYDGLSFMTNGLMLSDGAQLRMDGGVARIAAQATFGVDTQFTGNGLVDFAAGGVTLVNNGAIRPGTLAGLRLRQIGGGSIDLDGTSGDGAIQMATYNLLEGRGAKLRLDGGSLSDAFSGSIMLGPDSDLFMNLDQEWAADASSEIRMTGLSQAPQVPGVIRGSALDFAGRMRVSGVPTSAGRLQVLSNELTLRESVQIQLVEQSRLTLGGAETTAVLVEGGTYTLDEGAVLRFEAATEVRGGVFSSLSGDPEDGAVEFAAPTRYGGSATFATFARQIGDATVVAPTTINADRFYMSVSDETVWAINNALSVNANRIGTSSNEFRGDMTIGGGFFGRFTPNVGVLDGQWTMQGNLSLLGDATVFVTRVAGSDLKLRGMLSVPSGRAEITADTFVHSGSSVSLPGASSALRMRGYTSIEPGVEFSGAGTLHNGVGGVMVLHDGVTLNQVGLVNDANLYIGFEDGVASVDRFTNTSGGTLNVQIIGYAAGFENDLLLVSSGVAALGGQLRVGTFPVGPGGILPEVGDEFTIIAALGGVSGTFVNSPVSMWNGLTFDWAVVYRSHTVAVRLERVVPSPGAVALLGLGALVAVRRRRIGRGAL